MLKYVVLLAFVAGASATICPGHKRYCVGNSTCCAGAESGVWQCCSFPLAMCCKNHKSCCPHNYECGDNTCIPPRVTDLATPILEVAELSDANSICPDGKSECPGSTTCCKMANGQYGCCHFPEATCCSDHEHCCPHGYRCDLTNGSCASPPQQDGLLHTVPMAKSLPAQQINHSTCPGSEDCDLTKSTCCKVTDDKHHCCPIASAVCCSGGLCCPHGFMCGNGGCVKMFGSATVAQP